MKLLTKTEGTIKEGMRVTYTRDGIFKFKGIKLNITEARQLADIIAEILTGKLFLVSSNIPNEMIENSELLIKEIDKRIRSKNMPFVAER